MIIEPTKVDSANADSSVMLAVDMPPEPVQKILRVVCAWCQKYRTGKNTWRHLDETLQTNLAPENISHGICPTCLKKVRAKQRI